MSEPLTELDASLDVLVVAMQDLRDLEGLVDGMAGYEAVLRLIPVGSPFAIEALGVSRIWGALSAVATEILKLREVANGSA